MGCACSLPCLRGERERERERERAKGTLIVSLPLSASVVTFTVALYIESPPDGDIITARVLIKPIHYQVILRKHLRDIKEPVSGSFKR